MSWLIVVEDAVVLKELVEMQITGASYWSSIERDPFG